MLGAERRMKLKGGSSAEGKGGMPYRKKKKRVVCVHERRRGGLTALFIIQSCREN